MSDYKIGTRFELDFDKEINQGHSGWPRNEIYGNPIIREIIGIFHCEFYDEVYYLYTIQDRIGKNNTYSEKRKHVASHKELDKYYKII